MKFLPAFFLVVLGLPLSSLAEGGIEGKKAPHLDVDEWVLLPKGQKKGPKLEDLKGKVVYLYCFQSWCPGCHSSGFPALEEVLNAYKDDPKVVVLAVQTVFEGFGTNTPEAAKKIARKYKLEGIPMGQSGAKGKPSKIMRGFRTRGTPWTIIIGSDGVVRFDDFHIKPAAARKLIDKLKKKS